MVILQINKDSNNLLVRCLGGMPFIEENWINLKKKVTINQENPMSKLKCN